MWCVTNIIIPLLPSSCKSAAAAAAAVVITIPFSDQYMKESAAAAVWLQLLLLPQIIY